jgi:hypothetical protein
LGVPLAALLILVVLVLFGLPIGPPEPLTGVVERLGNAQRNLIAFVRVRDGSIMEVSISQDDECHPGNLIRFHLQRHLLGAMAIAGFFPCTTSSDHPL